MDKQIDFDVSQEECEKLVQLHSSQAAAEIIVLRAFNQNLEKDVIKLMRIKNMTMGLVQGLISDGDHSDAVLELYELLQDI